MNESLLLLYSGPWPLTERLSSFPDVDAMHEDIDRAERAMLGGRRAFLLDARALGVAGGVVHVHCAEVRQVERQA